MYKRQVPAGVENQNEEDPTDREWLWSKSGEKGERNIVNSLFDTTGYVYPEAGVDTMINLGAGDAITNTAFDPPEGGVSGPITNGVIQLQKYINDPTDLGVTSFEDLDNLVDTLNDGTVQILGQVYEKWVLAMDEISYEPYSENGFDVVRVNFRILVDKTKTHVFTFPSAGFNYITNDSPPARRKIKDEKTGEDITTARLLDDTGGVIPEPTSAPFISTPYLISIGRNPLGDWSSLAFPATIP